MTSKIEWLRSADGRPGYTINPVKGLCPMACSYCYARRMYKRFKWDERIEYWPESIMETSFYKKPAKIFVGSTMELFGPWVKDWMMKEILRLCAERSVFGHTYIFLTKQPQNLPKEWPDNCWVGVSAVDKIHFLAACHYLSGIEATVKFLSFEPLLESMESAQPIGQHLYNGGINWVIIGRQTPLSDKTLPPIRDIQKIVDGANEIPIPVFLKDNLKSFLPFRQFPDRWKDVYRLRQEFPAV